MDELTKQKQEQIKAVVEKAKRDGKHIDIATAVFC